MGHDDYWVALSREGALLGGGFFLTRSYALTVTACVRDLHPGERVDLHTAHGLPLTGMVFEVAVDVGLALISVLPDPRADYATPLADHAVKGDDWRAPYRPGPVSTALSGTVDEVTHDRQDGDGRPVSVIELATDQVVRHYEGYSGGPVERRTEGKDPAVLGILLAPDFARRLRDGAENALAAGAISSALAVFEELSAERLMGLLRGGVQEPAAATGSLPDPDPDPNPDPNPDPGPASEGRAQAVLDAGWSMLREYKQMALEDVVDVRDLPPYQARVLNVIADAWEDEIRD